MPEFDDSWRTADLEESAEEGGFGDWERMILSQIADLRDFAEAPEPAYPEMGVDAPRRPDHGARANDLHWYNHSVPDYLECAMAGTLGGWDDAGGIVELGPQTWSDMTRFLLCGQIYE